MDSLVLTLGHGSSAILIKDNKIINGYMNERVTKIKSDSQFPLAAIEELLKFDSISKDVTVYVSHWEPTACLDKMSNRHWNRDYLNKKFPKHSIKTLGLNFTHHKAHAYSALAYFDNIPNGSHIMVADGFGNYGEVLSIYEMQGGTPVCIMSCHDYNASLGLLYQYATDYTGLKMNQDEWKLNAAATNIDKNDMYQLDNIASKIADTYYHRLIGGIAGSGDPITELGALSYTHKEVLDLCAHYFDVDDKASIAYVLQMVVESCISRLIKLHNIERLYCVGGVFMNVQLNGYLTRVIKDKVGVMPLSGDSGAALGVYKYWNDSFKIPMDLCWGKRNLNICDTGFVVCTNTLDKALTSFLRKGYIVNVVRGNMEFGERAYCNTSTIALPTKENAEIINKANGRDSSMPMAPVVSRLAYTHLFKDTDKVEKSVEHMIMSLPYSQPELWVNSGISHYLPDECIYTGRPQVVDPGHYMYEVCEEFGALINTSFNIHGQPICLTMDDVLKAHDYQQRSDDSGKFITLIEVDDNE